jgi:hypothetical protein
MTVSEKLETVLPYYTQPGIMSDPGEYELLLHALPEDITGLVRAVQGLMLHVFWAERYGVKLSDERKAEVQIRPVRRKLARLLEIDGRPLSEPRPAELRLVGNCRDFSLLLATMLKAHGIPARARCGFGTYFIPGHYEDHWMTEYWHAREARWVQVDAQLDDLQRQVLGIQFDPLDMPSGQFVTGGAAWQMCRLGAANPDDFGIFEFKGWDFVKGDLLHDLRALNKMEVLPWDAAGLNMVPFTRLTQQQLDLLDRVAELTLAGNEGFEDLRSTYTANEDLQAPEEWGN